VIISGRTVQEVISARSGMLQISLDLGRTQGSVSIRSDVVTLPEGASVPMAALRELRLKPEDCVVLQDGCWQKIYIFSETKSTYYKLYQPVADKAPTIIINGATMHAIVGKDPWQYTVDKVATVPRFMGECLDTCCGLGYSAQLLAARRTGRVTVCEVDRYVLEVGSVNPWSEGLFTDAQIDIVQSDLRQYVAESASNRFGCVFHDPPTVYQAGELYSGELYGQFARVLRAGGVLYHYVGAPGRRVGQDHSRGVMRRLQSAGLVRVRRVTDGVLAFKPT